jgi:hypothetical protein
VLVDPVKKVSTLTLVLLLKENVRQVATTRQRDRTRRRWPVNHRIYTALNSLTTNQ